MKPEGIDVLYGVVVIVALLFVLFTPRKDKPK